MANWLNFATRMPTPTLPAPRLAPPWMRLCQQYDCAEHGTKNATRHISVRRRLFNVVDAEHIYGRFARFQLQPELFSNGGEDGQAGWIVGRPFRPVGRVLQFHIKHPLLACPIHNMSADRCFEELSKQWQRQSSTHEMSRPDRSESAAD